jgi:hypothetical protein
MEVDVQKRLLGGLACQLNVSQPTYRECQSEALKPHNKYGKRCVITALSCADDFTEVPSAGYARRTAHIEVDPE